MGDQISTLSLTELQTIRADLINKLKRVNDRIRVLMEDETVTASGSSAGASKSSASSAPTKKKVVKKVAKTGDASGSSSASAPVPAPAPASAKPAERVSEDSQEDGEGLLKKVTMDDMKFILNKNKIEWSKSMKRADLAQLIRTNALVRKALKYHNDRMNAKSASAAGGAAAVDSD